MTKIELSRIIRVERLSEIYPLNGQFRMKTTDSLSIVCRAPKDLSGIYLLYKEGVSIDNLLYIGSSGRKIQVFSLTGLQSYSLHLWTIFKSCWKDIIKIFDGSDLNNFIWQVLTHFTSIYLLNWFLLVKNLWLHSD